MVFRRIDAIIESLACFKQKNNDINHIKNNATNKLIWLKQHCTQLLLFPGFVFGTRAQKRKTITYYEPCFLQPTAPFAWGSASVAQLVFKPLSKYYVQQLAIGHCQLIIADTAAVVCLNFYNFLQTKTYFYCVFFTFQPSVWIPEAPWK